LRTDRASAGAIVKGQAINKLGHSVALAKALFHNLFIRLSISYRDKFFAICYRFWALLYKSSFATANGQT